MAILRKKPAGKKPVSYQKRENGSLDWTRRGIYDGIAEHEEDLSSPETAQFSPGSMLLCLDSNLFYIKNSAGQWQALPAMSPGDGSTSQTPAESAAALTDELVQAGLDCFAHVAWAGSNGKQYYDALELAAFPPVSISAVYTQTASVYDTDSLDCLKPDLVVTAAYENGTTKVVAAADYLLSGALTAGNSTIQVSFGGKSTTFLVAVTETLWSFTNGYTVVKGTGAGAGKAWRQETGARACGQDPIANKQYVFTVTDPAKYMLAAYDISSITKKTASVPQSALDGYYYASGNKSIAWAESDSVTTPYVWLALKKTDGTAFTDEELANGAAAVFTYTEGQAS